MQKLIKQSDAAVLIVKNKDDLNEMGRELKTHVKYLSLNETVIVKQSTILVITIEEMDSFLPLMKNKKLRFLLKSGSSLVFLRTCFFSNPYY
jgi:hypothetical protein